MAVSHRAPGVALHGQLTARLALVVDSIGYLVPRVPLSGRVHSVFARACNIACGDTLLTLCANEFGDGPTVWRLAARAPRDLRALFVAGEVVHGRRGGLQTARAELLWMQASVWSPAPLGDALPPSRVHAHLGHAQRRLALHRRTHSSVIDGAGASVAAALRDACRVLDTESALRQIDRLVGWGEGLTPAGDDFLVGLAAGLDGFVHGPLRGELRGAVASALRRAAPRTTPIAAHWLRLAADGHYVEPLLRLRRALLCSDDRVVVDMALRSALAVGATSGADVVSGLLAGLLAWLPAGSAAEAA